MLAIRWARIRRANVVATRRTYGPCSYCTQEGRSLALTETDTESDLDWQHPVDKEDIPLELMRLHDEIKREMEAERKVAEEIVKMPEYQYYHKLLYARLQATEDKLVKTGVWGKELTQRIDKELEEVMHTTDEEFHAFYKKKDETLFERYNTMIESGKEDPELIDYLTDGEKTVPDDIDFLEAPPKSIFFDDEPEPKDDEEDSDDEFSDIEELRKKADLDLRGEGGARTSFNYEDSKKEGLYGNYEDLNLWREEDDSSPFAGVDRIMAHFKEAREREHKGLPTDEQEEFQEFMKFLSSDEKAAEAANLLAMKSKNKLEDDLPEDLVTGKEDFQELEKRTRRETGGFGSEHERDRGNGRRGIGTGRGKR